MDIREIVRRAQCGQSDRAIAQDLGVELCEFHVDRKTVGAYRRWAQEKGVSLEAATSLPSEAELERLLASGAMAPYQDATRDVSLWRTRGRDEDGEFDRVRAGRQAEIVGEHLKPLFGSRVVGRGAGCPSLRDETTGRNQISEHCFERRAEL